MILLYVNIRFMRIFAEGPWEGRQTTVELSTTAIFSVFAGYFFGNFNIRLAVRRRHFSDLKMHDRK